MLSEETEPRDLSPDMFGGFSVCVMACGTEAGGLKTEGVCPVDHFLAVLLPRVETESSLFPYPEEGNIVVVTVGLVGVWR